MIAYWTIERPNDEDSVDDEDDDPDSTRPSRKRKWKPPVRPAPIKTPIMTFEGHSGCVSAVKFMKELNGTDTDSANVLYSAGWDHTVRVWDIGGRANTSTMVCNPDKITALPIIDWWA